MKSGNLSIGKRATIFVARVLTTTAITAFLGAMLSFMFAPNLFVAGLPLARGLIAFVFPIPLILAALVTLAVPTTYLLRRYRLESWATYAFVGALLGAVYLYILYPGVTSFGIGTAALYGCVCAVTWFAVQRTT